ncbi:hypothetical protein NBRC116589_06700 [Ruegeria sp. HU-ET01832]|uniref:hypothetical protein n=1 Tax=Ruegeria sp. HU-ET01832 TaxID=3135906 RepID=UPI00310C0859
MASEEIHRIQLRRALDDAARIQGVLLTAEARAIFVNRAIQHIYARYLAEQNRDTEVEKATRNAQVLLRNLSPLVENRVSKSIDDTAVRGFIERSTNCIYPFCRPTP